MKAMILAGGLSTRLYPLTRDVPKPLVPVAGVPNAVHVIDYLRSFGFDEIAINTHYLAEAIEAALGDGSAFGVRLTYSFEPELLGSAGAVKRLQPFFGDETFAVVGCDDLTDLPLDQLLDFHRENDAVATIGLAQCEEVDQYGVVVVDAGGRITAFQEKPPKGTEQSKLANTGIYMFSPAIFERILPETFYDFGKQVFPDLQRANAPFFGFQAPGTYWSDIGTPGEYRRASFDVVRGVARLPGVRGSGIDESARVDNSAVIEGPVYVGADARIEAGAHIVGPSVIGSGVLVGRDARIVRSIIWEGAHIGNTASLTDTVVGLRHHVPPNTTLTNATVANDPTPPA